MKKRLRKKKTEKKVPEPKDMDIDYLIENFDTLEERIEYCFSDIDFDKMRKHMPKRPYRQPTSAAEDEETAKKLEAFVTNKGKDK